MRVRFSDTRLCECYLCLTLKNFLPGSSVDRLVSDLACSPAGKVSKCNSYNSTPQVLQSH